MKRIIITIMLVVLTSLISQPVAANTLAQTTERCFPETGYCISGAIRQYWEQNGGLAVFGYPTSQLQLESVESWSGPVQWFERDRLEDHSNENLGVLAGRLGADLLDREGQSWQPGSETPQAGCRFFEITGYNLCGKFLSYWENNGGLERFGYPITGVSRERLTTEFPGTELEIQYFERRRMELHPENAAPYDVLLGLLGNEISRHHSRCETQVSNFFKSAHTKLHRENLALGCPTSDTTELVQGSYLYFEKGEMVWIPTGSGSSLIFVYFWHGDVNEPSNEYYVFPDACCDANSKPYISKNPNPSPNQYYPRNGFLRVWENNPQIRERIGWATMPEERSIQAGYQQFGDRSLVFGMYPRFSRWMLNDANNQARQIVP
jgi:hypothetical protein